jgi:hypothetical protein
MSLRAVCFKDGFKEPTDVIICENKYYVKINKALDELSSFSKEDVIEALSKLNCEYSYIKIDRTINYG